VPCAQLHITDEPYREGKPVFYYINGIVTELEPNLAVIDCGGVGYKLSTTSYTLGQLKLGEKAKLYTYLNVKEDCFDLFGFASKGEKRCFEMLIGVSGVGPKAALSILSSTTPEALMMNIISGNDKALTAAQGIGKKIAQRIILELKDKMAGETGDNFTRDSGFAPVTVPDGGKLSDAVAALAVLGYSSTEINSALKRIDTEALGLEEIIKAALKQMIK